MLKDLILFCAHKLHFKGTTMDSNYIINMFMSDVEYFTKLLQKALFENATMWKFLYHF